MTLEKKRERKQLQQEQQSSRISGTVTFIATKRNFIFCIFFFLVLLLIFYFLKIPATGEEPFSSENRTQNGSLVPATALCFRSVLDFYVASNRAFFLPFQPLSF